MRPARAVQSFAWAALLALAACGRSPSAPPSTPPPAQPGAERIVALSPGIAVLLRDLGHTDRIVARHAYDLVLPASVPVAGDNFEIDYELLLRLSPTRIYTQREAAGLPERLTDLASRHGWTLRDFHLLTLDQIARAMDALAEDLGDASDAADGRPPSQRLAADWAGRGPAAASAGRVLLLGSTDPPAVLGPGSFHHDLLLRLGGQSLFTSGSASPWMELDAEDILALAPDAIIVFAPRAGGTDAGRPGWDAVSGRLGALAGLPIPAVQRRRVAVIDHPLGLLPSSALGPIGREMGALLVGWGEDPTEPRP